MKNEQSIFARSFSKNDVKNFACGAIFVFFVMEFTLLTIFNLPILNLQKSVSSGLKMLMNFQKLDKQLQIYSHVEIVGSIYNLTNARSEVYEINGDIRIHNDSSTIFMASDFGLGNMSRSWITRPYPRKHDNTKFEPIREWKILIPGSEKIPNCTKRLNIPAILFSTGAFSSNYFHSFTDLLIPLYLTSREYKGNVIFLITHYRSWWNSKHGKILEELSKHDIIDIDNENEVLCFSKLIIGLKSNREFGFDPKIPPHYSTKEFRQFLQATYSLDREIASKFYKNCRVKKAHLLIVSRKKSRRLINEGELANLARKMGFDVVVEEMGSNIPEVAKLVNSIDVMVGVHGAGLTNMVFLRENAVVIQIIPFGLAWESSNFFKNPAEDMNLRYLEYNVSINESSLFGKYPNDSLVYRDPHALHMKLGWSVFRSTYFAQNVSVDLVRFREKLLRAMEFVST